MLRLVTIFFLTVTECNRNRDKGKGIDADNMGIMGANVMKREGSNWREMETWGLGCGGSGNGGGGGVAPIQHIGFIRAYNPLLDTRRPVVYRVWVRAVCQSVVSAQQAIPQGLNGEPLD
jgi:hypothetical protein